MVFENTRIDKMTKLSIEKLVKIAFKRTLFNDIFKKI